MIGLSEKPEIALAPEAGPVRLTQLITYAHFASSFTNSVQLVISACGMSMLRYYPVLIVEPFWTGRIYQSIPAGEANGD